MRRPSALTTGVIAALVVVVVGSAASAQRAVPAAVPSAVPAPLVGHPGNPVPVENGAFHVSGTAGTIVHVHLNAPLEPLFGSDYDRRVTVITDADVVMVAFEPERQVGLGDRGSSATITLAKPAFLCAKAATCQPDHAAVYQPYETYFYPQEGIPAGDYVLALLGPVGAHVDVTYLDFYGRQKPSEVAHLYPMPYTAGLAVDLPAPDPPNRNYGPGDRSAQYLAPLLGARVLGGVAIAIEDSVGDSRGFTLTQCALYGRVRPSLRSDPKTGPNSCLAIGTGGRTGPESIYGHDPDTGASVPAPYVVLRGASATSDTDEDSMMGGGYGLDCSSHCQSRAYAFTVAVDS